jgi:hypothetical protein
MDTRTLALSRAAGILGGPGALAEHLGVSRQAVRGMLCGHLPVPQWIFLRTVDVISDSLLTAEAPAV